MRGSFLAKNCGIITLVEELKKISAIIVNINSKEVLYISLSNLKDIYPNLEVIVVDNGSTDGAVEMMRNDFPWVKLIASENGGLASGLNKALNLVTGEYIYYLGNDTFPEKPAFLGLIDYFENHPDVGAATTKLASRGEDMDWDAHRGFPTPWVSFTHFTKLEKLFPKSKMFGGYFMSYLDMHKEHEIDATITHSLFIRKSVQEQVGLWDENFFLYGEDLDMCCRIKEAGWKLMYLPQFRALHWKGVLIGRKVSKDSRVAKAYTIYGKSYSPGEFRIQIKKWSTGAMKLFYDKHYKDKYPMLITWLVHLSISVMTALRVFGQKLENRKLTPTL